MRELARFEDQIAGMIGNHESFVSECGIAEGSDLARQARHDRNFQGAGQRANHDAQVESRR